jgi:hypothetical protein
MAFIFFAGLLLSSNLCYAQKGSTLSGVGSLPSKMSVFGEISVPVLIAGISFEVRFAPELQSAETMAIQFCTEQAGTLNIKEENFSDCVTNVGNHLLNQVNTWYIEKTFQTPLTLNGQILDVSFIPEKTSVESVAEKICKANVEPNILTECAEKVIDFLRAQVAAFYAEKTLVVPITVEDKAFDISFLPERHSTRNIAIRICNENSEEFKLTDKTMLPCVEKMEATLEKSVAVWIASKTLDFNMSINDKVYPFSMIPERQSATQVARSFCIQRSQDFGFTSENIAAECISPIADNILQVIKRWIASKEVVVRVDLGNGEAMDVSYLPDRQTSLTAATRFCINNGARMGFTNETIQKGCIEPLAKSLREAATKKQNQQVSTDGTTTAVANAEFQ